MAQTIPQPEPFVTGVRMEREEFLRRWEALPEIKNAELIEGIVYVASPVGYRHAEFDNFFATWAGHYAAYNPNVKAGQSVTIEMLDAAPQPDVCLWLRPEHGGRVREGVTLLRGAPDLVVEVTESSYSTDFGPKKALYQRAGVQEYITADVFRRRLIWRRLDDGSYVDLTPDSDGTLRSRQFPGLCLDPAHVWALDRAAMIALLDRACTDKGA